MTKFQMMILTLAAMAFMSPTAVQVQGLPSGLADLLTGLTAPATQGPHLWDQPSITIPATIPGVHLNDDDFVFSAKITPDGGTANHGEHGGTIFGRHASGVAKGWALSLTTSLHVHFGIYGITGYDFKSNWVPSCVTDSVTLNGLWGTELMSATALTKNQEQTIALVRTGKMFKLYVDEVLSCTATFDSWNAGGGDQPASVNPDRLVLGAHMDGMSNTKSPFQGTIKQAYIERGSDYPPAVIGATDPTTPPTDVPTTPPTDVPTTPPTDVPTTPPTDVPTTPPTDVPTAPPPTNCTKYMVDFLDRVNDVEFKVRPTTCSDLPMEDMYQYTCADYKPTSCQYTKTWLSNADEKCCVCGGGDGATKSDVKAVIIEIRTQFRKCKAEFRAKNNDDRKATREAFLAVKADYLATKRVLRKLKREAPRLGYLP